MESKEGILKDGEWKDLVGYEGYYEVSEHGSIRRNGKRGRVVYLLGTITVYGYKSYSLKKDGLTKVLRAHRCVAQTFIPNPENKPYINHIDGNKLNNHVSNLEWVTPKENSIHAVKMGLLKPYIPPSGKDSPYSIPIEEIDENGNVINVYHSISDAVENTGISYLSISRNINGKYPFCIKRTKHIFRNKK